MTDDQIIDIINELNQFENHGNNFSRQSIAKDVDIIHYWRQDAPSNYNPLLFFLIKKKNVGIGAVLDMNSDLHWVMKPEYRGQKLMSNAIRNVILPYIFFHLDRNEQEISIYENDIGAENYTASKALALRVGFCETSSNKFIYDRRDYDKKNSCLRIKHDSFSPEEVSSYELEIENSVKTIFKLKMKLEASYTTAEIKRYSKQLPLQKIAETLRSFRFNFIDIHHDSLMNKK